MKSILEFLAFIIQAIIYAFSVFVGGLLFFGMCFVWLIFAALVLVFGLFEDLVSKIKNAR